MALDQMMTLQHELALLYCLSTQSCVELAVQANEIQKAIEAHHKIFPVSIQLKSSNWISRVKVAINLQGREVGLERDPMKLLNDDEENMLIALLPLKFWKTFMNIQDRRDAQ